MPRPRLRPANPKLAGHRLAFVIVATLLLSTGVLVVGIWGVRAILVGTTALAGSSTVGHEDEPGARPPSRRVP